MRHVASRLLCLQVYCGADFGFLHTLSEFLPTNKPVTVLDAGANIGAASLLFAHLIGMHGQVVAVEAFPPNYNQLTRNMGSLKQVITPVAKAIVTHPVALAGGKMKFTGTLLHSCILTMLRNVICRVLHARVRQEAAAQLLSYFAGIAPEPHPFGHSTCMLTPVH